MKKDEIADHINRTRQVDVRKKSEMDLHRSTSRDAGLNGGVSSLVESMLADPQFTEMLSSKTVGIADQNSLGTIATNATMGMTKLPPSLQSTSSSSQEKKGAFHHLFNMPKKHGALASSSGATCSKRPTERIASSGTTCSKRPTERRPEGDEVLRRKRQCRREEGSSKPSIQRAENVYDRENADIEAFLSTISYD